MEVIQVKLQYENTERVVWVNFDKRIKVGARLSLREDKNKFYKIACVYGTTDSENLHSDWNVGGLVK